MSTRYYDKKMTRSLSQSALVHDVNNDATYMTLREGNKVYRVPVKVVHDPTRKVEQIATAGSGQDDVSMTVDPKTAALESTDGNWTIKSSHEQKQSLRLRNAELSELFIPPAFVQSSKQVAKAYSNGRQTTAARADGHYQKHTAAAEVKKRSRTPEPRATYGRHFEQVRDRSAPSRGVDGAATVYVAYPVGATLPRSRIHSSSGGGGGGGDAARSSNVKTLRHNTPTGRSMPGGPIIVPEPASTRTQQRKQPVYQVHQHQQAQVHHHQRQAQQHHHRQVHHHSYQQQLQLETYQLQTYHHGPPSPSSTIRDFEMSEFDSVPGSPHDQSMDHHHYHHQHHHQHHHQFTSVSAAGPVQTSTPPASTRIYVKRSQSDDEPHRKFVVAAAAGGGKSRRHLSENLYVKPGDDALDHRRDHRAPALSSPRARHVTAAEPAAVYRGEVVKVKVAGHKATAAAGGAGGAGTMRKPAKDVAKDDVDGKDVSVYKYVTYPEMERLHNAKHNENSSSRTAGEPLGGDTHHRDVVSTAMVHTTETTLNNDVIDTRMTRAMKDQHLDNDDVDKHVIDYNANDVATTTTTTFSSDVASGSRSKSDDSGGGDDGVDESVTMRSRSVSNPDDETTNDDDDDANMYSVAFIEHF